MHAHLPRKPPGCASPGELPIVSAPQHCLQAQNVHEWPRVITLAKDQILMEDKVF